MADPKEEVIEQEISESSEVPAELETKTTEEETTATEESTEPELSKREQLYKKIAENDGPAVEEESTEEPEEKKDDETEEVDPVQEKINKRIGKEVAKRKTAEERNIDLEAENVRLREKIDAPKNDEKKEPTYVEIKAAYAKALEDGDHTYAADINELWMDRKEKDALAEVRSENDKTSKANEETRTKWVTLVQDNTVYSDKDRTQIDMNHPLNLNNQNSALYKTAMSYMNDKELAKTNGYDNADKILGFRLAVNDARRDLMELVDDGKLNLTVHKKEKIDIKPKQRKKSALAISTTEASGSDAASLPKNSADKAVSEIARRKKLKEARMVSPGS